MSDLAAALVCLTSVAWLVTLVLVLRVADRRWRPLIQGALASLAAALGQRLQVPTLDDEPPGRLYTPLTDDENGADADVWP